MGILFNSEDNSYFIRFNPLRRMVSRLFLNARTRVSVSESVKGPHGPEPEPEAEPGAEVAKEDIMGLLAAVEMWVERDHEAERRTWAGRETPCRALRRNCAAGAADRHQVGFEATLGDFLG